MRHNTWMIVGIIALAVIILLVLWWLWYDADRNDGCCDRYDDGKNNLMDTSFLVSQRVRGMGAGKKIKLFDMPYTEVMTTRRV